MDLVVSGIYLHLLAFNQCFAKAGISGDVRFLFRKLYQVFVNAKCMQKAKQFSWMPMGARGKNLLCGNDCKCGTESKS